MMDKGWLYQEQEDWIKTQYGITKKVYFLSWKCIPMNEKKQFQVEFFFFLIIIHLN